MMHFSVSQNKIIIQERGITKECVIETILKLQTKCLVRLLDFKF